MELDIGGERKVDSPTKEQVVAEIEILRSGESTDFVILSHGRSFVQACRTSETGYLLEFFDETKAILFQQDNESARKSTVIAAFTSFLQSTPEIKALGWRRAEMQPDAVAPSYSLEESSQPVTMARSSQPLQLQQAIPSEQLSVWDVYGGWTINPAMICPHCQTRGSVKTRSIKQKVGVSGGKATAALLTAGLSLFAVGLSRKAKMTEASCGNCHSEWHF